MPTLSKHLQEFYNIFVLIHCLCGFKEMKNGFDKNVALKQARRNLAEYIINVPKTCLPNKHYSGIYHLRSSRISEHYNDDMGFDLETDLPPEKSSDIF